jgi:Tol biopolymer transport system component/DNA-binding winged helix-turn-helix (wHTH) protein
MPPERIYRFNGVVVDVAAMRACRGTAELSLEPKTFRLLQFLIENRERVLSKEVIFETVWEGQAVSDNALTRAVAQIRKALDDDPRNPRYIDTVPTIGYRFIGTLEAEQTAAQPVARPATRKYWPWAVLAVALTALLFAAIGRWAPRWRSGSGETLDEASLTQVTASTAADITPSLSPDGSQVAYSSDKDGSFEIYVKTLAPGSREVRLTTDENDNFEPAWSPDGRQIAYCSRKKGGIWLIPAFGGTARRLTEFGSWPAWSPDSARIVFESQVSGDFSQVGFAAMPPSTLWVVSAQEGSAPKQLTHAGNPSGGHGAPTWSPDGMHIAFSSTSTSFGEIWSVPAGGGAPQRLVPGGGYDPVYGPGGHYLYFSQGWTNSGRLMRVALKNDGAVDGKPELVRDTGSVIYRGLHFSANGQQLVFSAVAASNNLQSIHVSTRSGEATGGPIALTGDTAVRKTSPRFSPGGGQIAYTVMQTGEDIAVWVVGADGKNAHPLGVTATNGLLAGWMRAGNRIGFVGEQNQQTGQKLLEAFDLDAGTTAVLRRFGFNDAPLRLSPDGKNVAYGSRQGGAVNVWVAPMNGAPARQLTFGKALMSYPCWSPDGKTIAFEDGDAIGIVPAEGGPVTRLTPNDIPRFIGDWSPDGEKIVYAAQRNGVWNIWWVSRRTKQEKQITHYTSDNTYVRYPAWSPRDNQIVYEFAQTTGNIWTMKVR